MLADPELPILEGEATPAKPTTRRPPPSQRLLSFQMALLGSRTQRRMSQRARHNSQSYANGHVPALCADIPCVVMPALLAVIALTPLAAAAKATKKAR